MTLADVFRKNLLLKSTGKNSKSRRSRENLRDYVEAENSTLRGRSKLVKKTMRPDSGRTLISLNNTINARKG